MELREYYTKIGRIADISELIAAIVVNNLPGEYRFASRFPEEAVEFRQIAEDFQKFHLSKVAQLGYYMGGLISALDATDRVLKVYHCESRESLEQLDRLLASITELDTARKELPVYLGGAV